MASAMDMARRQRLVGCIRTKLAEGIPRKQAIAMCLAMDKKKRLDAQGAYERVARMGQREPVPTVADVQEIMDLSINLSGGYDDVAYAINQLGRIEALAKAARELLESGAKPMSWQKAKVATAESSLRDVVQALDAVKGK